MDELRIVRRAYTVGPLGPRGPLGPVGPKGEQGPIGLKGDKGDMGPMGPRGFQGPQGEKGDKGDAGSIGPIGPLGPKGDKGDQGVQGIQGPIGPQGPKGDIGEAFSIFNTYDSVSSMNADKNNVPFNKFVIITSDVEDSDNADLYIRTDSEESGFKFITNLSGALGIQGPKGDKGDKGDSFTYADFTAAQLEALRGPLGIQGIQGEQGPAGQDGSDGQDGAPGLDGHSPVVTASKSGTTTTIYVDGTSIATIEDGQDGTNGTNGLDGHTPIITATKSNGVTTISSDNTAIATINDGVDAVSPTLATVATSGDYNDLINKPNNTLVQTDWNESDSSQVAYIKNKPIVPAISTEFEYVDLGLPSGTLWERYYACDISYPERKLYSYNSSYSIGRHGDQFVKNTLGGSWELPTKLQFEELIDNTTPHVINVIQWSSSTTDDLEYHIRFISNTDNTKYVDFNYRYNTYYGTYGSHNFLSSTKYNSDTYYCLHLTYSNNNQDVSATISTVSLPILISSSTNDWQGEGVNVKGVLNSIPVKQQENVPIFSVGHSYVDLGLPSGTLWANVNVGASNETSIGTIVDFVNGGALTQFEQCGKSWGGSWHAPTADQAQELLDNTTHTFDTINGVNGLKFVAQNGNYIFLPATEYYSSNNFYAGYATKEKSCAGILNISFASKSDSSLNNYGRISESTYTGNSGDVAIRPVLDGAPINVPTIWRGTQAQYDAITTPDDNTIYIITSAS